MLLFFPAGLKQEVTAPGKDIHMLLAFDISHWKAMSVQETDISILSFEISSSVII